MKFKEFVINNNKKKNLYIKYFVILSFIHFI